MAFVSNNTSNQKDSNPQKSQKDEVAAQPTNNKESKPLKSFKKSSSNKSSKIKYVVLVVLLIVLSTAGVLYLMEEQKEAPVPTVPESEPEASSDSAPCTLSFSVPTPTSTPDPTSTPTPTPDPTPVPIYPQCHSIEMLDEQDRPIYEYDITPNLNVTLACLGNFSTQSGGVPIEWMEFRALKKEVCLPGEDCSIIEAEQVWISKNQGDLAFNDNIVTGYANYTTQLGLHAVQCRVCTTSIEDACDGEWDDILNWPDTPEYGEDEGELVCESQPYNQYCNTNNECADCYGNGYQCSFNYCQPTHCELAAPDMSCDQDAECIDCYGTTARCVNNQCGIPTGIGDGIIGPE